MGTFIFSEILVNIGPMNGIFGSIIAFFGVFSAGYHLFQFCFFLGDFADGRLLHYVEVHSSMDLHFILSNTAQKMKFWSHLLKKSLMESFVFCAV